MPIEDAFLADLRLCWKCPAAGWVWNVVPAFVSPSGKAVMLSSKAWSLQFGGETRFTRLAPGGEGRSLESDSHRLRTTSALSTSAPTAEPRRNALRSAEPRKLARRTGAIKQANNPPTAPVLICIPGMQFPAAPVVRSVPAGPLSVQSHPTSPASYGPTEMRAPSTLDFIAKTARRDPVHAKQGYRLPAAN